MSILQKTTALAILLSGFNLSAQTDISFKIESQTTAPGGTVSVPVKVENYEAAAFQFSLNWDPAVLEYDSLSVDLESDAVAKLFGGLIFQPFGGDVQVNPANVNVESGNVDNGRLGVFHNDAANNNQAINDDATLFIVNFNVLGGEGDSSPVTFNDAPPTDRAVSNASGGAENFVSVNGTITIANPPTITSTLGDQTADEDTPLEGLTFTVADEETAAGDLIPGYTQTGALIASVDFVNNDGAVSATINWVPNANGNGTITFNVTDSGGGTASADPINITLNPVNDDPIAELDTRSTDEDTAITIENILDNDSDVDGDTLSILSIDTSATVGTVTDNGDGTFGYDPNGQFDSLAAGGSDADSFTYTISDGNGGEATGTVSISINGVNDAPVGVEDLAITDEDTALPVISVLNNDTDPEGDTLGIAAFDTTLTSGTVVDNGDGTFSYDPNGQFENLGPGENNTDTFTYTITDGNGGVSAEEIPVTVTITGVNDDPIAGDDSGAGFATDEDTVFTTGSVLGNDSDIEEDPISVSGFAQPASGAMVTDNGDGTFSYDPNGAYDNLGMGASDSDTFTYTISDSAGGSAEGTVTISISGVNDAPEAVDDPGLASASTDEDSPVNITGFLANDTDVDDGDSFSLMSVSAESTLGATVSIDGDEIRYDPTSSTTLNALGVGSAPMTDVFTYTIEDVNGLTDVAEVSVDVSGVNDDPIASDDTFTAVKDTVDNILDVVGNAGGGADTDPDDGDTVSVSSVNSPGSEGGTITLGGDGSLRYTPVAGLTDVTETFTYTIVDGNGGSDSATVTINLITNPSPIAVADSASGIVEDSVDNPIDVLSNDSDPEDEPISLVSVQNPSDNGGAVTINGTNDGLLYSPAENFSGEDTFTYTITDGTSNSIATVTVTVDEVNDDPIISDVGDVEIEENLAIQPSMAMVSFTASDVETASGDLTYGFTSSNESLVPPANIAPTATANGVLNLDLDITPVENVAGTAEITVTVTDESGATASDSFTLTVLDLNPIGGTSHDGLLSATTIYFDGNLNGLSDVGEPSVISNGTGAFNLIVPIAEFDTDGNGSIDSDEGRLVSSGGRDIATGLDLSADLLAPVGSTVVNPLTTLIQLVIESEGVSPSSAESSVESSLGTPSALALRSSDLFALTSGGDASAAAALLAGAQVWDTVLGVGSLVAANTGSSKADVVAAGLDHVVQQIIAGNTIDFTNAVQLEALINAVGASFGSTISNATRAAAVAILADVNGIKAGFAGSAPADLARDVSRLQAVAQSTVAEALAALGAGGVDVEDTEVALTGAALQEIADAAPAGDIDGSATDSGSFSFELANAKVDEDGVVFTPAVIKRENGNIGVVTVTVTPVDGTAEEPGDFDPTPVDITFQDREIRKEVNLAGIVSNDGVAEGSESFTLELSAGPGFPGDASIGAANSSVVEIIDGQNAGSFAFASATGSAEEELASVANDITIQRSGSNNGSVDVLVTLNLDGTADAGDFTSLDPISVNFADGALTRRISLPVLDDIFVEGDDTFSISLEFAGGAPASASIGAQSTLGYTIINDDFNTAPTITAIPDQVTNEDTTVSANFTIGDLENDPLTVTATSSNPGVIPNANITLAGGGASRSITLAPAANQFGSSTISVVVSDGKVQTVEDFLVTVNAVNDAPVLAPIPNRSVVIDDLVTVSFSIEFSDPDFDPNSTFFSFESSNTALVPLGRIQITGTGLRRTLNVTPIRGAVGQTEITIRVRDAQFESAQSFLLTVATPNRIPTISDVPDQSIDEDSALSVAFSVGDDKTAPSDLLVSAEASDSDLFSNVAVTGTGGQRVVTATPKENATGSALFTLSVNDGELTATDSFIVTVNAVNDAPTVVSSVSEVSIVGIGSAQAELTLDDIDSPVDSLVVTLASSDEEVVPVADLVLEGEGATRTLTINTAKEDANAGVFVTATVSDGDMASSTSILVLARATVSAPEISGLIDFDFDEDTTGTRAFTVSDANNEASELSVSAISGDEALIPASGLQIQGDGSEKELVLTPAANANGVVPITVTVSDGENDMSTTIQVTVNPVEDAPSISAIEDLAVVEGRSGQVDFQISDPDTDLDSLTVGATSSNADLVGPIGVRLSGSGANRTLRLLPFIDVLGSSTIEITATDPATGLSSSESFEFSVVEFNAPPTISAEDARISASIGGQASTQLSINDPDDSVRRLTVSVATSNPEVVPEDAIEILGALGQRSLRVTPAALGEAVITVSVSDEFSTASVTVLVVTAPTVTITKDGDNVRVTWNTGFLESAPTALGPWTRVEPSIEGPAEIELPVSDLQGYFRGFLE